MYRPGGVQHDAPVSVEGPVTDGHVAAEEEAEAEAVVEHELEQSLERVPGAEVGLGHDVDVGGVLVSASKCSIRSKSEGS